MDLQGKMKLWRTDNPLLLLKQAVWVVSMADSGISVREHSNNSDFGKIAASQSAASGSCVSLTSGISLKRPAPQVSRTPYYQPRIPSYPKLVVKTNIPGTRRVDLRVVAVGGGCPGKVPSGAD